MNFRNRKLIIAVRVVLGLFLIFSGVSGLMAGALPEGVPQALVPTVQAFWGSGIFHLIKITEIIAGLMLVTDFLPALGTIFVAPICVGIIVFHLKLAPASIVPGVIVTLLTIFLGYAYWDKYRPLFQRA